MGFYEQVISRSKTLKYMGYAIVYNFYGHDEYTVQYCGDDVTFKTVDEAKAFIKEVANEA